MDWVSNGQIFRSKGQWEHEAPKSGLRQGSIYAGQFLRTPLADLRGVRINRI